MTMVLDRSEKNMHPSANIHIPKQANDWSKTKRLDNKSCALCSFDFWPVLHSHHILPRSAGGSDDKSNLVILCPTCHALVHHFISHHESYGSENEGNHSIMWSKQTAWQLYEYAEKLAMFAHDLFVDLVVKGCRGVGVGGDYVSD